MRPAVAGWDVLRSWCPEPLLVCTDVRARLAFGPLWFYPPPGRQEGNLGMLKRQQHLTVSLLKRRIKDIRQ